MLHQPIPRQKHPPRRFARKKAKAKPAKQKTVKPRAVTKVVPKVAARSEISASIRAKETKRKGREPRAAKE